MKKILVFAFASLLLNVGYSQKNQNSQNSPNAQNPQNVSTRQNHQSSQHSPNISQYRNLSQQQLFDTAHHYYLLNNIDVALLCYGLIIKTPQPQKNNYEQQVRAITALNRTGIIYMNMSDFRNAYKNFIDALLLCEEYNVLSEQAKIYNNLGNIYYEFKKYNIAQSYYNKSLMLCEDTASLPICYNNLGIVLSENGEIDSAFIFLNKSLQICKQYGNNLSVISNSIASLFHKIKQYDSAYYYYNLSVREARKNNLVQSEIESLSDLSELFFETKQIDSALFYINLSNTLARKNNYLSVLATNNLVWSKIRESEGYIRDALDYYKKYADLKDSVFSTSIFGDINQLQHSYDVYKTNQQIDKLVVKQQIRERVILIILCVLVLVCILLLYIYLQKRNLNKAYKILFEKNIEIINFQENSPEKYRENENDKRKNLANNLANNIQDELFDKILPVMENNALIYDTDFSIEKLAEIVQSNRTYVSQVINNVTNKNFRSFLNGYRIREAQKIFSGPDIAKYTIESVALRVGFKSRSAFYDAFKDITGVSPNFYLKSMEKQREV